MANLYFNGVRPDGEYGLKPRSEQELVNHIFEGRDAAEKAGERLQKQLERKTVDRLQDIVAALTTRAVALFPDAEGKMPADAPTTSDAWLDTLAGDIVALLLGEAGRKSGVAQELAAQLKQDPSETLRLLVAYLAKGDVKSLVTFLLNPDPDMQAEFKEKLKRETDQKLLDITKDALSDKRIKEVFEKDALRLVWREELVEKLAELQTSLQSMTALSDFKYIVSNPVTAVKLGDKLTALMPDNPVWQSAIAQVNTVVARSKNAAWRDLVEALRGALQAFCDVIPGTLTDWQALQQALAVWMEELRREIGHLGLIASLDPGKLNEAGWGIIFPVRMPASRKKAIREALEPLLCRRLIQTDLAIYGDTTKYVGKSLNELLEARADKELHPKYQEHFKIYEGGDGYRPNDTARAFLGRHNARPEDPANPELVPYYLLLVGTPEEIPFEFQYQLDVQYAVGRLDFDDPADYRVYAENVIAAETTVPSTKPQMTLFGVRNDGDTSTQLSSENLIQPLYDIFKQKVESDEWKARKYPAWNVDCIAPAEAKKNKLLDLLTTLTPPTLLFTASHGMEFDSGSKAQVAQQGALLCSDWPGPHATNKQEIKPEWYLSGADVLARKDAINARGMIAFFFACYGAGTPRYDEFTQQAFKEKGQTIAEKPFVAALPKALLSAPRGALAVIGHVERAWAASFMQPEGKSGKPDTLPTFESLVQSLLTGLPVGAAMEYFNVRYAALSTELTAAYNAQPGQEPNDHEMAQLWTGNNDARGYIILGDPAVRLRPFAS